MKYVLLLLLAWTVSWAEIQAGEARNLEREKRVAMALMEDVVPHSPVSSEIKKISNEQSRAYWGPIFGDAQIGALVAVQLDAGKEEKDAHLCLLLWKDGWNFAQWIGPVSSSADYNQAWDWGIKRRVPDGPCYVINCFDVNRISYRKHFSWICDRDTHSLRPTGWPENALPSISGRTITFQRCDKSGYVPDIVEICEFDGTPRKTLATYSIAYGEGHRALITITVPVPTSGKNVTWRIREASPLYEPYHDRFSLCYSPAGRKSEPFHEDATLDVQWNQGQERTNAISFLIWRLTGLESAAQRGEWDEDVLREKGMSNLEITKPAKTVIIGIPEAVESFSWPKSQ